MVERYEKIIFIGLIISFIGFIGFMVQTNIDSKIPPKYYCYENGMRMGPVSQIPPDTSTLLPYVFTMICGMITLVVGGVDENIYNKRKTINIKE
jgi:hypothetical protein